MKIAIPGNVLSASYRCSSNLISGLVPSMRWIAAYTTAFFLFASSAPAQEATFEGLGALPDSWSRADNVSADGSVVVGRSGSLGNPTIAIRWENGEMESLGNFPGGDSAVAHDVSADGSIVVGQGTTDIGGEIFIRDIEAFRREGGEMEGLGYLPGGEPLSIAFGVSADGSVVVGTSGSGSDMGFDAFRWENGEMIVLGDLFGGGVGAGATGVSNDGSVIVGQSPSPSESGFECFRWENGEMEGLGTLPGGDFYSGQCAVSADGSVVVGESSSSDGLQAFRWENGEMQGLGALRPPGEGFISQARAVSVDGSIVVGRSNSDVTEAIIWTEVAGMRSLNEVLEIDYGLDLEGWVLQDVYGISDDGSVLVGYGSNQGNTEAWRVTGLNEGMGTSAKLSITPSEFDFGEVRIGESSFCEIEVINAAKPGANALTLLPADLSGDDMFEITGGDCDENTVLEPQQSCRIEVTFNPETEGFFTAQVTVASGDDHSETADLNGAGIEPSKPHNEIFLDRFENDH